MLTVEIRDLGRLFLQRIVNMTRLLAIAVLSVSVGYAHAGTLLPPELVGVWATEGSAFKGDALMNGQALYLDTDGIGASIGGDGKAVIGVRIVVTSYNPSTKVLAIDLTEHGKIMAQVVMTYLPSEHVITDGRQRYHRRFDAVSAQMRASINLEPKAK
jgi:hypothetical protein